MDAQPKQQPAGSSDPIFLEEAISFLGVPCTHERTSHGDQSRVYRISTPQEETFYLKITSDGKKEALRLGWLEGKVPVPHVHAIFEKGPDVATLLSEIPGQDLATWKQTWEPDRVTTALAAALKKFHEIPIESPPFVRTEPEDVLVHGDACLPNVLFDETGSLTGFVDLSDMRAGNRDIDLSAAIWSLRYNMGPGHGVAFLQKYGINNADEALEAHLYQKYQDSYPS